MDADRDWISHDALTPEGEDQVHSLYFDSELRLDHLLAQVTPENLHGGMDSGPSVGAEVW